MLLWLEALPIVLCSIRNTHKGTGVHLCKIITSRPASLSGTTDFWLRYQMQVKLQGNSCCSKVKGGFKPHMKLAEKPGEEKEQEVN